VKSCEIGRSEIDQGAGRRANVFRERINDFAQSDVLIVPGCCGEGLSGGGASNGIVEVYPGLDPLVQATLAVGLTVLGNHRVTHEAETNRTIDSIDLQC